ncbi:MAG: hypothetical protein Q8P59_01320 [Dehalococcoidia bacterium]|nr:hypothetical protein [Dehalococcoidia bacterium]
MYGSVAQLAASLVAEGHDLVGKGKDHQIDVPRLQVGLIDHGLNDLVSEGPLGGYCHLHTLKVRRGLDLA